MRHRFVHLVNVARYSDQVVDRQRVAGSAIVLRDVECLVEPKATQETQTQAGRVSQFDHVITWGEEHIKASDVVTWIDPLRLVERRFIVQRVIPDTSRPFSSIPPYHVAELLEQVARS